MTSWIAVVLLGGMVGLDATTFPQVMISRPVVAGVLTGLLFGRPLEGLALGFVMEAFALIVLPIGAARYPESGTATVAAASGYLTAVPPGLDGGALLLAVVFGLAWERLAGETVVLQRRGNGRILIARGPLSPVELERRHLGAMTLDFARAGVVAGAGGVTGYALLSIVAPVWGLPHEISIAALGIVTAGMLGTMFRLFAAGRPARSALVAGLALGTALAAVVAL